MHTNYCGLGLILLQDTTTPKGEGEGSCGHNQTCQQITCFEKCLHVLLYIDLNYYQQNIHSHKLVFINHKRVDTKHKRYVKNIA